MTIHKATDVNTEVLFRDASTLGISFHDPNRPRDLNVFHSIYSLARECDQLSRKVPYPSKDNYRRYNVYQKGKVLGENLTLSEKNHVMKEHPKALVEQVEHDSFKDDLDKYNTYQAMIRQTFSWGMYYIEDLLDNPKAVKAFTIAWDRGHSGGYSYSEIANEFGELIDLIK
jgi:hypothetical protein